MFCDFHFQHSDFFFQRRFLCSLLGYHFFERGDSLLSSEVGDDLGRDVVPVVVNVNVGRD